MVVARRATPSSARRMGYAPVAPGNNEGKVVVWLPDLADPAWVTAAVRRHAGAIGLAEPVGAVRILDARLSHPHRPGWRRGSGWGSYLVTCGSGPASRLLVRGFPDGSAAARPPWAEAAGAAVRLPDSDLEVWRFPDDPRLAALRALSDPRALRRMLPRRVVDVLDLGAADPLEATVVRYQPQTSVLVRVTASRHGSAVFAKHLAGGLAPLVAATHAALWLHGLEAPALRLAEPLAFDAGSHVLWTRAAEGGAALGGVTAEQLPDLAGQLGGLLSALHSAPVEVPDRLSVAALVREASKKAAKLAAAHPPVAERVRQLAKAVGSRAARAGPERAALLHGDFHVAQVLTGGGSPVLVDLDTVTRGCPEIDLAEFAVDLAGRDLAPAVLRRTVGALLASYADRTGAALDHELLAACADAEFLNRCYRHPRRHAPGWREALEAEVDRHPVVAALVAA